MIAPRGEFLTHWVLWRSAQDHHRTSALRREGARLPLSILDSISSSTRREWRSGAEWYLAVLTARP